MQAVAKNGQVMNDFPGRFAARPRVAAVLRSSEEATALCDVVHGISHVDFEIHLGGIGEICRSLINSHTPDILLVDLGSDITSALEELSRFFREHPERPQILASAEAAPVDAVRRLMRLGVADFIPKPLDREDVIVAIEAALARLSPASNGAARCGKIVSFAGSCGGAGTTTLALQAAAELRCGGQSPASVCIVDLDLQFGNVALSLDLKPTVGLREILNAPKRVDVEFLKASMSRHSSGIEVLAGPDTVMSPDELAPEMARHILTLSAQAYDFVIVDLPHVWTESTLAGVEASDLLVVVTNFTVAAVHRCRRQLELLARHKLEATSLALVVNRLEAGWSARPRHKQVETAFGRRIDAFVREDPIASTARDEGVLLRDVKSRSRIEKDVGRLVDGLIRPLLHPPAATPAQAGRHS